jgi:cytochrome bd ubiquinol oxidase subunit II
MDLNQIWFLLIAVLYAGFFFLEGFDFGVGMWMPFLGRNDLERRTILQTVGPHWDANEVWLITAGGATFAAFPQWYAAMFSGFYPLLLLLLLALIVRGVAFEFRGRHPGASWRRAWDAAIGIGSILPPMLLGMVFADLVGGVPMDAHGTYVGNYLDLLQPFACMSGLAVVSLCLLQGANFLAVKTEGELGERAWTAARRVWWCAVPLVILSLWWVYAPRGTEQPIAWKMLAADVITILSVLLAGYFLLKKREGWAFVLGGVSIVSLLSAFFIALFPRVMISSIQSDFSLTIYNAASSDYTLRVMTIVALIFVPVVLAYQAWSYWVFRRRVSANPESLVY